METATLFVHIAAGCVAILAGYVAIFATKGAGVHRRSGTWFVWAMVVMGLTASGVAAFRGIQGSLLGGPMVAYFAVTAWTTVKPIDRRLDIAMAFVGLFVGVMSYWGAAELVSQGKTMTDNGAPVPMVLFLGTVLLLSVLSDVRILGGAALVESRRIARHLWRMCFSLWIAAASFFLGQMDEFPKFLQKPALMAIPAMLPLLLMVYWLWRVRGRGLLKGLMFRSPVPIPLSTSTEYPQ